MFIGIVTFADRRSASGLCLFCCPENLYFLIISRPDCCFFLVYRICKEAGIQQDKMTITQLTWIMLLQQLFYCSRHSLVLPTVIKKQTVTSTYIKWIYLVTFIWFLSINLYMVALSPLSHPHQRRHEYAFTLINSRMFKPILFKINKVPTQIWLYTEDKV